jgi:hypothetical protein
MPARKPISRMTVMELAEYMDRELRMPERKCWRLKVDRCRVAFCLPLLKTR